MVDPSDINTDQILSDLSVQLIFVIAYRKNVSDIINAIH
jgi:hypothetical protein